MPDPLFVPQPNHIERRDGAFPLTSLTRIWLSPKASEASCFAAQDLAAWIQRQTGLNLSLEYLAAPGVRPANTILLTLQDQSDQNAEGYTLDIRPDSIEIAASGEAGLFYGVQTLAQVLQTCGRRLPALTITDAPVLAQRGVMLDVSRACVPQLHFLKRLVTLLAHFKINQFQLYTEHTFLVSRRRAFGESMGALTGEEMRELDAFCRARHVELVPNFQSFGHQRHLLSLPEYSHLSETAWKWTLSPAREETYELLGNVYDEMLPNFTSTQFNIDCDETWDHGVGQSKALAEARGKGRLYLDHILRLRDLAAKHGKQLQMWADIILEHPELIPEVPDDILLLDWRYENLDAYPTVEEIAKAGRRFMVCPGVSSWNTLFPRIDNALGNIRGYTRAGVEQGAIGMLNTDWGDGGHYQQPSHSFYGYVFGAETAWTGGATEPADFDRAVGPLLFGDLSGQVVAAIRQMGRAVENPVLHKPNRSDAIFALLDDPLGGLMANTPVEVIDQLRAAGEAGLAAFASLKDEQMRHELGFTAYQMTFIADKLSLTRELRAALAEGGDVTPFIERLKTQREALIAMQAEFEQLWLTVSKRAEIQQTLNRYAGIIGRYDKAIEWFQASNRDLSTYSTQGYEILWQESRRFLQELVDEVGFDNLPPIIQTWIGNARQRQQQQ